MMEKSENKTSESGQNREAIRVSPLSVWRLCYEDNWIVQGVNDAIWQVSGLRLQGYHVYACIGVEVVESMPWH